MTPRPDDRPPSTPRSSPVPTALPTPRRGTVRHRLRRAVAVAATAALTATGLALGGATVAAPAVATIPGDKDTTALMFQWTWNAIADECTSTLGPAGYGYVLTSPPQEHVLGSQWWTSYQPVSYKIESKLGTRAEFAAMVSACHDAGV